MKEKGNSKNNIFLLILFLIIIVLMSFFPSIYSYFQKQKFPKIPVVDNNEIQEENVVPMDVLNEIYRPVMRDGVYNSETYYSLDEFKIDDMSNNDKLYNAYLSIEEQTLNKSSEIAACTNDPMEFDANIIKLRIENVLGKNINYTFDSFYVYEGSENNYIGNWNYDSTRLKFVYNGLCESKKLDTSYYDLEELIKAEYQDRDIVVYYYVGFAKVVDNVYHIYNDPNMTDEISSGEFINKDELNIAFKNIDNKYKKIYKYTFKNSLCRYEYCLYKGEWVNEF